MKGLQNSLPKPSKSIVSNKKLGRVARNNSPNFYALPVIFVIFATTFFFLFFLAAIFAIIPIVDILALVNAEPVAFDILVITGFVIETPFWHANTSSIAQDMLQHFECCRFLCIFFGGRFCRERFTFFCYTTSTFPNRIAVFIVRLLKIIDGD